MVSPKLNASAPRKQDNPRYDTLCSDDPNTVIIRTDGINKISDFVLNDGVGSVVVEAGQ